MLQHRIEEVLEQSFGQIVLSKGRIIATTETLEQDYERFKERDLFGFDVAYLFVNAVYDLLRRYSSYVRVLVLLGNLQRRFAGVPDLGIANNDSPEALAKLLQVMILRALKPPLIMTSDCAASLTKVLDAT